MRTLARILLAAVSLVLFLSVLPDTMEAKGSRPGRHSYSTHARSRSSTHYRSSTIHRAKSSPAIRSTKSHRSSYVYGVQRDSHGKIKRSEASKRAFMKQTGYPHGRRGYVIDHIVPLSRGGSDNPSNMQWETKEEAKAKDKWERKR